METVNLKKLENEFLTRLLEESITKKQNQIRFQTISDPQITYQQYMDLLRGAHLQPIRKCHQKEHEKGFKQTVSYTDFGTSSK